MKCELCKEVELTKQEEANIKKCFFCCKRAYHKAEKLGMQFPMPKEEDFGRTEEEVNAYKHSVKTTVVDPQEDTREAEKQVEKQVTEIVGNSVFPAVKTKTITVNLPPAEGDLVNEDVSLSLKVPGYFHINEKYWNSTEALMNMMFEIIIHQLQFGPVAGTQLEEMLAEKLEKRKQGPQ